MIGTNGLIVVITITIIIVEKESGDAHLVVRTAMVKVMTVSACNVSIRTSVVSLDTGESSESGRSITMSTCVLTGCGVELLSLISSS